MYAQQIAAALQYAERHHPEPRVKRTEWALRFSMGSRLLADSVRHRFASDPARRTRLAEDIGVWRAALDRARRPAAR